MSLQSRQKLWQWLPAFAVLVIYILALLPVCSVTLDDSFISYRYAVHLTEGKGLVFNTGERVEGFSNLLWVLILACWHWLGADLEWTSKLLGIISGIGIILLSMQLLRRHFRANNLFVFFLGLYLATSTGLIYYAISGMETLFYALQIVLFTKFLLEDKPWFAAFMNVTLIMTRPEGLLFIAPLVLYSAIKSQPRMRALTIPLIPVLWLGLLTLWRLSYYHALLPNTFYAKIKTQWDFIDHVVWHLRTFVNSLYTHFAWNDMVLLFAAFYMIFSYKKRDLIPAAVLACLFFFVWYSGADWMSFGRFFVPALPLLGLFACAGLQHLLGRASASRKCRWRLSLWLAIPILFNLVSYHYGTAALNTGRNINPAMHSRQHRHLGHYLKSIAQPGDVLVINELGAVGYITDLPIVDMIGLADKTIPGFWKTNDLQGYADYIFSKQPRFIALNDRQVPTDVAMHPMHQVLYDRILQDPAYHFLTSFPLNEYKNLLIYEWR